MERGSGDTHLDAALNPALLEGEASQLNALLQVEGQSEEAEKAAAAAVEAAARSLAATLPAMSVLVSRWRAFMDVARRVVAPGWSSAVERKACPLLNLLQRHPDFFAKEVLERLDPTDRTMLAQVGRPWLAAALTSELPRLAGGVKARLWLDEFCTSVERLTWAKANGCPWAVPGYSGWRNPCALAARGGHLAALQWARESDCPWDERRCGRAPGVVAVGAGARLSMGCVDVFLCA